MASQMMEKIAQTEQACDRMKENARREAAAILDRLLENQNDENGEAGR